MKLGRYILHSLWVVSVTGRHVLLVRQEATTSLDSSTAAVTETSVASGSSAALASTASQPAGSAAASSAAASPESSKPSSTIAQPSTFSLVPGSSPTLTTSTPATNQTTIGDPVPLPIPPKLTPAVGLAGAILMITGLAYGLVGIRNKWLYTFFGVTYLVSLAVLVLIIYCMNPPVTDGVQGAYFVAVSLTGALCGGVALVFRDLADGFGCLLGGFCVAMWFLTLKPGGVIPSTVGRAVFIGALTLIVGATGLNKRTRRWGLIGSIPFSGATVAILGIDCFSRAGMKEFWIYLWNLNDDEFPLNTTTYPLTRGMKVEIAGIIILFLLGLVSQIKLSKVLKERKEMLEQRRIRKLDESTRENTAAGRRVTSTSQKEQGRWESVYGGKSVSTLTMVPSSETVDKKGFIVKERHISSGPGLEMASIEPMTGRVANAESIAEIQRSPHLEPQDPRLSTANRSRTSRTSVAASEQAQSDATRKRESQADSVRNSLAPPAPEVVPLPFKIPGIEVNRAKSHGSLSAIEEDYLAQRISVQRASGGSWKRSSIRTSIIEATASREELMIPEDDDNASSVAATFDELDEDQMSLSAITLPRSPIDDNFSLPSPQFSNRVSIAASLGDVQRSPNLDAGVTDAVTGNPGIESRLKPKASEKRDSVSPSAPFEINSAPAVSIPRSEASDAAQSPLQSPTENMLSLAPAPNDEPAVENQGALAISSAASKRSSAQSDQRKSALSNSSADKSGKLKIAVPQGPSQPLTHEILTEQVADGVSRITLQYRTNEWAKHLEGAQEPEEDAMTLPPSPGVQVDTVFRDALDHTPLSPVVDPNQLTMPMIVAKRSSTDPSAHQRKKSRSEALAKLTSTTQPEPLSTQRQNSERNVSSPPRRRPSSSTVPWPGPAQRMSRTVSSPVLGQPIVESPIEARSEDPRKGLQKRTSYAKTPMPENTLMVQRDSRLESKPKSQSFAQSAPNLAVTPATPAASVNGKTSPLQKTPSPDQSGRTSQLRHTSSSRQGAFTPQPIISPEATQFDSHQPHRRTSAVLSASQQRRENLLTNWRESIREDQNPQKPASQQKPVADDMQRQRLLQEKRLRQATREQEKLAKAKKEEKISSKMMKGGNLVDAHRLAMKNMQAGVKQ